MGKNCNPAVASVAAAICGLAPLPALAGEWSGQSTIDKIVVHADQDISVYKTSALGGQQEPWPNPDGCDNSSRVILRPVRSVDDVVTGIQSYEQAYAALLGAQLNGHRVSVFLNGCTSIRGVTFPLIEAVATK